jgi:hypothetical protein
VTPCKEEVPRVYLLFQTAGFSPNGSRMRLREKSITSMSFGTTPNKDVVVVVRPSGKNNRHRPRQYRLACLWWFKFDEERCHAGNV